MNHAFDQTVGAVFVGEDKYGRKAFYQRTSTGLAEVLAVYAEDLMFMYPVKVIRVIGTIKADDASLMELRGEAY